MTFLLNALVVVGAIILSVLLIMLVKLVRPSHQTQPQPETDLELGALPAATILVTSHSHVWAKQEVSQVSHSQVSVDSKNQTSPQSSGGRVFQAEPGISEESDQGRLRSPTSTGIAVLPRAGTLQCNALEGRHSRRKPAFTLQEISDMARAGETGSSRSSRRDAWRWESSRQNKDNNLPASERRARWRSQRHLHASRSRSQRRHQKQEEAEDFADKEVKLSSKEESAASVLTQVPNQEISSGVDAFQGEVGTSEEDFDECQPRSPKGAGIAALPSNLQSSTLEAEGQSEPGEPKPAAIDEETLPPNSPAEYSPSEDSPVTTRKGQSEPGEGKPAIDEETLPPNSPAEYSPSEDSPVTMRKGQSEPGEGKPAMDEDHAVKACAAAGAMQQAIGPSHYEITECGLQPLEKAELLNVSLLEKIGQGSYSVIYKWHFRSSEVAIKKPFAPGEAATLRSLAHPRVLTLIGEFGDCLITEFMAKGSLYQCLRKETPLTLATRSKMAIQVCEGVEFLHGRSPPVVHRDLKSPNILVDESYNAKLADFDMAECLLTPTITLRMAGSPLYFAPECFSVEVEGIVRISEKADMWALGCILVECFGGRLPNDDCQNIEQLVTKVVTNKQSPDIPAHVPSGVRPIVEDCFEYLPEHRESAKNVYTRMRQLDFTQDRA